MPKKKVPGIPDEYPKPAEPMYEPVKVPEINPLPGEKPLQVPPESPEPEIPDEQPAIPPEIK